MANTWKFEKVFIYKGNNSGFTPGSAATGTDLTSNYTSEYIEFKKDGTYIWTDGSSSDVGTWVFASDKEDIVMTENGSSSADTYHIIKLKSKKFWLRRDYTDYNCSQCAATVEYDLSPR